ncbi:MAG: hypothetical protein JKY95_02775 [Planctomycetaceae bacterium]|nr:hypothetical protein [Planctomycetaceae bacterium]
MPRLRYLALVMTFIVMLSSAKGLLAHCEVPCGIYADERRFELMLEDQTTIAKAITQINELAGKTDAQSVNQLVRWINTKEEHATNTQHIIAQYFMTQRLKADKKGYDKKLVAAHAVMVAAMKCKQSTTADSAKALESSIKKFYEAYEGKKYGGDHGHSHSHK